MYTVLPPLRIHPDKFLSEDSSKPAFPSAGEAGKVNTIFTEVRCSDLDWAFVEGDQIDIKLNCPDAMIWVVQVVA